jgi:hypothetical protein
MVTAADRIGQREQLLRSLREFYPESVETVGRLLPTYPRHARRRVEELEEIGEWMRSAGHSGAMAAATGHVIADLAALDLPPGEAWDAERVLGECLSPGPAARAAPAVTRLSRWWRDQRRRIASS